MRLAAAQADRAAVVREAARGWHRAGILDAAGLAAVEQRYPDDRSRAGKVVRVLLFLFSVFAFTGMFGFVGLVAASGHEDVFAFLVISAGVGLWIFTEWLVGPMRRRQGGVEAASSFLAISCLLGGSALLVFRHLGQGTFDTSIGLLLAAAAGLLAIAAWHWGYPLYAGAAAAAFLMALARFPLGRFLWIAVALAAAKPLLHLAESLRLPPAQRASASAALLVVLAGLYAAINLSSWERHWVEGLAVHPPTDSAVLVQLATPLWWCSLAATLALPLLLMFYGARSRRVAILIVGVVGAILSLVTLHEHLHAIPIWLALTGGGAVTIAIALALTRWLESGPQGERHGFTAAPLLGASRIPQALEIGAVLVTLPHADARPQESGFTGGGGAGGGGGASGEF